MHRNVNIALHLHAEQSVRCMANAVEMTAVTAARVHVVRAHERVKFLDVHTQNRHAYAATYACRVLALSWIHTGGCCVCRQR
jgi:hypothetical protein